MIKIKYKLVYNKRDYGYDIKIRFPYTYYYDNTEEGQDEGCVIAVLKNLLDQLFWTFKKKPFVKTELNENGHKFSEFVSRRALVYKEDWEKVIKNEKKTTS